MHELMVYMKFIHYEGRIQSHKVNREKKIVHSYMHVNCWKNQTILSALALLRKFMRLLSYIHWNDSSPQHCCSSDTDSHLLYLNILRKQSFQHTPRSLTLLWVCALCRTNVSFITIDLQYAASCNAARTAWLLGQSNVALYCLKLHIADPVC